MDLLAVKYNKHIMIHLFQCDEPTQMMLSSYDPSPSGVKPNVSFDRYFQFCLYS